MVEMSIVGVRLELPAQNPVVLLKEVGGRRYLPIWIGQPEAAAIAMGMQKVVTPRPLTHDLMRDILKSLGVTIQRVVITDLRDGTFYAEIHLLQGGLSYEVSSRPSDAIALAVRTDVPVYCEEFVLEQAGVQVEESDEIEEELERFRQFLDNVTPEQFGQV